MDVGRLQGKLSEASGGLQDRRIAGSQRKAGRESRKRSRTQESCKARGARVWDGYQDRAGSKDRYAEGREGG